MDLEDPFGIDNNEFLLNGDYEDILSNILSEVVSWEVHEQIVKQSQKEAEEDLEFQNSLL